MNKKEKLYLIYNMFQNHINDSNSKAIAKNTNIICLFFGCGLINEKVFNNCFDLVKTNRYFDLCQARDELLKTFGLPIIY